MDWINENTALLIADMIYDFVDPDGALHVPNALNIVENIAGLISEARSVGAPVIYLNDAHLHDDLEFGQWPKHAIKGTRGAEVVKELEPVAGDIIVEKTRYSGFFKTNLESILEERATKRVVITGAVTNICVLTTAYDAVMRNIEVVVFRNAVAAIEEKDGEFALAQIEKVLGGTVI